MLQARFSLQTVNPLMASIREGLPTLAERMGLQVGDVPRLLVHDNATDSPVYPHVEVIEVTATGYVGIVGGAMNSEDWLPYGTRIVFTAEHIIEY